jgi:hypothetical protein
MLYTASTRKRPETAHMGTHSGYRAALASAQTLSLTQIKRRVMPQAEIAYLFKSLEYLGALMVILLLLSDCSPWHALWEMAPHLSGFLTEFLAGMVPHLSGFLCAWPHLAGRSLSTSIWSKRAACSSNAPKVPGESQNREEYASAPIATATCAPGAFLDGCQLDLPRTCLHRAGFAWKLHRRHWQFSRRWLF